MVLRQLRRQLSRTMAALTMLGNLWRLQQTRAASQSTSRARAFKSGLRSSKVSGTVVEEVDGTQARTGAPFFKLKSKLSLKQLSAWRARLGRELRQLKPDLPDKEVRWLVGLAVEPFDQIEAEEALK